MDTEKLRKAIDERGATVSGTNATVMSNSSLEALRDAAREALARREAEEPKVTLEEMEQNCRIAANCGAIGASCLRAAADVLKRLREFKASFEHDASINHSPDFLQKQTHRFLATLP